MNTNLREKEHKDVGEDVYDYYESLTERVTGGEFQNVSFLSFDSSEPPCPIGPGQFTRLKLTDSSCQITSFENSFIQLEITGTFNFRPIKGPDFSTIGSYFSPDHYGEFANELKKIPVFYVGFKSGLQCIDHYRFYNSFHAGPLCEQSQAIYESALTYMTKAQEEIEGKIARYAVEDEINNCKEDIPGFYVTLEDLEGNSSEAHSKTFTKTFTVNIPYDDFAPLQFFKNYPNVICGDLQIEFKINNNKNMVIFPLDFETAFKKTFRNKQSIEGLLQGKGGPFSSYFYSSLTQKLSQYFINLGDECRTYYYKPYKEEQSSTSVGLLSSEPNEWIITCSCGPLTLKSAKSFINCYNVPHDTHEKLRNLLTNTKIYIPGQRIDQYTFSQLPTVSSMNCNTTQSFVNCSSLAFTWPRSPNELTCSVNPRMTSIQLQIDNKTYPDKPFDTRSFEHSNYILTNLMFDDFFKPNKGLERALSKRLETEDNTNYAFVVSLERLDSSPFVFEGLTKDNCYITLNGTFDPQSPYSTLNTRQNPIMFVCQDTLWELSAGDINYYYNDRSIIPRITNN